MALQLYYPIWNYSRQPIVKAIKNFGNNFKLMQDNKKICNMKSLAFRFWRMVMSSVWSIFSRAILALWYVVPRKSNGNAKNPAKYVFISCANAWDSGPSLMLMNKSIAKNKVIFFNNVPSVISSFFSHNCSKWALVVSCILGTKLCKPIGLKKDERIWRPFLNIQNHNLLVMPIPNYHSPLYFHD